MKIGITIHEIKSPEYKLNIDFNCLSVLLEYIFLTYFEVFFWLVNWNQVKRI